MFDGKRRFVIRNGLMWALSTWVLWSIHMASTDDSRGFLESLARYGVSLPAWLVGGWFWGLAMWYFLTRRNKGAKGNGSHQVNK
jgi:hypothetical protein